MQRHYDRAISQTGQLFDQLQKGRCSMRTSWTQPSAERWERRERGRRKKEMKRFFSSLAWPVTSFSSLRDFVRNDGGGFGRHYTAAMAGLVFFTILLGTSGIALIAMLLMGDGGAVTLLASVTLISYAGGIMLAHDASYFRY